MNSLYERFNQPQQTSQNIQNGMPDLATFARQFYQTNTLSPKQVVMNLINSGHMTQEQFNQLAAVANQLTGRK